MTMKGISSQATLVLNSSYEPLMVISIKRAIILLISDKASMVEEGQGSIKSAHSSMPVPSVIILNNYVKIPYSGRVGLSRRAVLQRDNFKCVYCGKKADTVDHVIPRSKGGKDVWENLVAACAKDNRIKGSKTLKELGWTLQTPPYQPKGRAWRLRGSRFYTSSWEKWFN